MDHFILDFVIPEDADGGWADLIDEEKIEDKDQKEKIPSYKEH